jgi:hypothetical protein
LTFDYPTIGAIAEYLCREAVPSVSSMASVPPVIKGEDADRADFAELERLPQDQVKILLDEELELIEALMKKDPND